MIFGFLGVQIRTQSKVHNRLNLFELKWLLKKSFARAFNLGRCPDLPRYPDNKAERAIPTLLAPHTRPTHAPHTLCTRPTHAPHTPRTRPAHAPHTPHTHPAHTSRTPHTHAPGRPPQHTSTPLTFCCPNTLAKMLQRLRYCHQLVSVFCPSLVDQMLLGKNAA